MKSRRVIRRQIEYMKHSHMWRAVWCEERQLEIGRYRTYEEAVAALEHPREKISKQLKCQGCGVEFETIDPRQRYCEPRCRHATNQRAFYNRGKEGGCNE